MNSAPANAPWKTLSLQAAASVQTMHLGAGRQTKESVLDYGAGIHLDKLVGDTVSPGEVLCTLRYNDADPTDSVRLAREAYRIGPTPPARESYILDVVTEGDH